MTEELILTAGVLVASAVCGWYVVRALTGVAVPLPDDVCATAMQCVAQAVGP